MPPHNPSWVAKLSPSVSKSYNKRYGKRYNMFEVALLLWFIVPAVIYGTLMVLPSLAFVLFQRFSHRRFPKLSLLIVCLTCISSFGVGLLVTTRSNINFTYRLEKPYTYFSELPKDPTEKRLFDSAVINEATYRSLMPVYFQRPCTRTPKIVCELGTQHAIDPPFVESIVSALTSAFLGFWAHKSINVNSLPSREGE